MGVDFHTNIYIEINIEIFDNLTQVLIYNYIYISMAVNKVNIYIYTVLSSKLYEKHVLP